VAFLFAQQFAQQNMKKIGEKKSFPDTSFNRELADNLLKHDFISSRKIKNGKINIYTFNSQ